MLRFAELLAQLGECGGIVVVAIDIAQQVHQSLLHLWIAATVVLQAVRRALLELIQIPSGLRDADDWDVQAFVAHQSKQRWEDLLVSQIAGGAEEDDGVRWLVGHRLTLLCRGLFDVAAEREPHRR